MSGGAFVTVALLSLEQRGPFPEVIGGHICGVIWFKSVAPSLQAVGLTPNSVENKRKVPDDFITLGRPALVDRDAVAEVFREVPVAM